MQKKIEIKEKETDSEPLSIFDLPRIVQEIEERFGNKKEVKDKSNGGI